MRHAFNPSRGKWLSVSSRAAWSIFPDQSGIHRELLSQRKEEEGREGRGRREKGKEDEVRHRNA